MAEDLSQIREIQDELRAYKKRTGKNFIRIALFHTALAETLVFGLYDTSVEIRQARNCLNSMYMGMRETLVLIDVLNAFGSRFYWRSGRGNEMVGWVVSIDVLSAALRILRKDLAQLEEMLSVSSTSKEFFALAALVD